MEMVMKFPNGETPNLLIEVFNYNPVCALQICYRHGYGFVMETRTRAELSANTRMLRSTSIVLLLLWWEQHNLRLQGKWQWNRRQWFRDGREGGTQVIKRLSRDCYFKGSWLLQSTCQRALQQILNSKLLPMIVWSVCLGVNGYRLQRNRRRQQCERVNADFWTLTPNIWKVVLQILNPGSMAISCLGHLLTLLPAETNTDVMLPQSVGNTLIFPMFVMISRIF